jgi:hypothetical protein
MYDEDWPVGQGGEPSRAPPRIVGVVLALLSSLALTFSPAPGEWRGSAGVSFAVDRGTGLVQPTVRVPRCGRHRARVVALGLVAAPTGQFDLRRRSRSVRVRLAGRFDSASSAHGVIRARLRFRGSAHRPCRVLHHWTAHPPSAAPGTADEAEALDDDVIIDDDGEPIEDGDYDEDEGPIDDDPGGGP